MIPNCATQERRAPRDFRTVIGMIGSDATYSSMIMKEIRRKEEITIGTQRTVDQESPKRKRHRQVVYKKSVRYGWFEKGIKLTRVTAPR